MCGRKQRELVWFLGKIRLYENRWVNKENSLVGINAEGVAPSTLMWVLTLIKI